MKIVTAILLRSTTCGKPRVLAILGGVPWGAFLLVLLSLLCVGRQSVFAQSGVDLAAQQCPELQSIDGVRALLSASRITSFAQCARLLSVPQAGEAADPIGDGLHNATLGATGLFFAFQAVCSVDSENTTCAPVQRTLDRLIVLSRDTQAQLSIWKARCSSAAIAAQQISAAPNITLESAVKGQLRCLGLAQQLINSTRSLTSGTCGVLTAGMFNVSLRLKAACTDLPAQLTVLEGATRLQTCVGVFVTDMSATSRRIAGLEGELQAKLSADQTSSSAVAVPQQAALMLCFELFQARPTTSSVPQGAKDKTRSAAFHAMANFTTQLTHITTQNTAMQLCPNTCHQLRNSLTFLVQYLNITQLPTLSMIAYTTSQHCLPISSSPAAMCLDVDSNFTLTNRSAISTQDAFCLNVRCHSPLRKTDNRDHWFPAIKSQASDLSRAAALVFPSADLLNATILNCGLDCVSLTFTSAEEKVLRVNRSVLGIISVLLNIFAVVTFFFNKSKLWRLPSRLNVYFNVSFLVGPGSNLLLAFSSPKAVACYSDGTVRLDEPNNGLSLCTFLAAKYFFGSYLMAFFGLALCVEWYRMIQMLRKPVLIKKLNQKTRERVYIIGSLCGASILVIVVLSRKLVRGAPSVRDCSLTPHGLFYYFCIPFLVVMLAMIPFLVVGLPKLTRLYKGVGGYLHHIKSQMAFSQSYSVNTDSTRFLEMMISRLQLYILILILGQAIITPCYVIIFRREDDVTNALQKRLLCLMTSCTPSKCPSLFRLGPELVLLPDTYLAVNGIATAIWALNYRMYWQRHMQHFSSILSWRSVRTKNGQTYRKSTSKDNDHETESNENDGQTHFTGLSMQSNSASKENLDSIESSKDKEGPLESSI